MLGLLRCQKRGEGCRRRFERGTEPDESGEVAVERVQFVPGCRTLGRVAAQHGGHYMKLRVIARHSLSHNDDPSRHQVRGSWLGERGFCLDTPGALRAYPRERIETPHEQASPTQKSGVSGGNAA
jgi:hypothetical protein